jgi:hypothetical protein
MSCNPHLIYKEEMDCYTITTHLKTSDYYFQTGFRCIGVLGIPVSSSTLVIAQKEHQFVIFTPIG